MPERKINGRENAMEIQDKHNLQRFLDAQANGAYESALSEIKAGRKRSHWMWFIFPQVDGLGHSATAVYYAIKSLDETREWLAQPELAARLREICGALLDNAKNDPEAILGWPDYLKLRSSMTLFDYICPNDVFARVLAKFFAGQRDNESLRIIGEMEAA